MEGNLVNVYYSEENVIQMSVLVVVILIAKLLKIIICKLSIVKIL